MTDSKLSSARAIPAEDKTARNLLVIITGCVQQAQDFLQGWDERSRGASPSLETETAPEISKPELLRIFPSVSTYREVN